MKFYLILFICIILNSCSMQKRTEKEYIKLINKYIETNYEYSLILRSKSFIPTLDTNLKNDENFNYTMTEVKESNFNKFYVANKKSKIIDWTNLINKAKVSENDFNIEISTPLIVNNNQALIQTITKNYNTFTVFQKKAGKWQLSYSFGYLVPSSE